MFINFIAVALRDFVAVHVDEVIPCLWTAATNRHFVHPQMKYEYEHLWWNNIDGKTE
jgi:hypothetical protein